MNNRKHNRMRGRNGQLAATRGQRQNNTRSQNEKEESSCEQIKPHFVLCSENIPEDMDEFIIECFHEDEDCIHKHHLTAKTLNIVLKR